MTGISRVCGSSLSLRQTSNPSISGIMTSRRIRSGGESVAAMRKAFSPLVAILVR